MNLSKRARILCLLLFTSIIILNCNFFSTAPLGGTVPTITSVWVAGPLKTALPPAVPAAVRPTHPAAATATVRVPAALPTLDPGVQSAETGEPAGCQAVQDEVPPAARSAAENLARADQMLGLSRPLNQRILDKNWNAYTHAYAAYSGGVMSLSVGDVQPRYLIQKMINALQVNGFITWLRQTPQQGLHILAFPVQHGDWLHTDWAPYVQAYWQERSTVPSGDPDILLALKIPPCRWMAQFGYPAQVDASKWFPSPPGWPNYSGPAAAYLADTNEAAIQVARQINWLGAGGQEGPNTMCGPLVWSILKDAGAFPPDWGGWSEGPKVFWLAKPRTNGRPWSLFPPESYHVYSFHEKLGKFDFSKFRLYPGDFLYTYSEGNGFDHMLVVTEVDSDGNVYTVTNRGQFVPVKQTTIERLLLANLDDPTVGIAHNQWANDRVNGRTGHAGFDVFRWAWMEKDILEQPVPYMVQAGDTLGLIAMRWKTPVEQIARYNGVTENDTLFIGQELQIPPNEMAGVQ